jgi:hypothetical protein
VNDLAGEDIAKALKNKKVKYIFANDDGYLHIELAESM